MRLNSYNSDLIRHLRAFGEGIAQFRDEHRKGGLVDCEKEGVVEFRANWRICEPEKDV